VVLLALGIAYPRPGGRLAAMRALVLLAITALLLTLGLLIGGSRYIHGVMLTTLGRAGGTDSPLSVLANSWSWTGVIVVVAVGGAIAGWVRQPGSSQAWLLTLFTAAAVLVPLEQASIRTDASLNKHGDLGAWFAAIAAGYAVDRFIAAAPAGNMRTITAGACVIALCFPVTVGVGQSRSFATSWPDSSAFAGIFGPLAAQGTGHLLVEDPQIAEYYLHVGSQWTRWSSTRNIILPSGAATGGPSSKAGVVGAGNAGTFAMYIQEGYFSLIALSFSDTTALDRSILTDIKKNPRYHRIQIVPYGNGPIGLDTGTYLIWRYVPKPKS
jgi:hypothetical protein